MIQNLDRIRDVCRYFLNDESGIVDSHTKELCAMILNDERYLVSMLSLQSFIFAACPRMLLELEMQTVFTMKFIPSMNLRDE